MGNGKRNKPRKRLPKNKNCIDNLLFYVLKYIRNNFVHKILEEEVVKMMRKDLQVKIDYKFNFEVSIYIKVMYKSIEMYPCWSIIKQIVNSGYQGEYSQNEDILEFCNCLKVTLLQIMEISHREMLPNLQLLKDKREMRDDLQDLITESIIEQLDKSFAQVNIDNPSLQLRHDNMSLQPNVASGSSSQINIKKTDMQRKHDDVYTQAELDNAFAPINHEGLSTHSEAANEPSQLMKHNDAFAQSKLGNEIAQTSELVSVNKPSQSDLDNACSHANLDVSPPSKLNNVSSEPNVFKTPSIRKLKKAESQAEHDNSYLQLDLDNSFAQENHDELSSQATVLNGLSQSEHDDLQSQVELGNACAHSDLDDSPPSKFNNVSTEPKVSNRSLKRRRKKAASLIKHNNANPQPGVDKAFAKKNLDDMSLQAKVPNGLSQPELDDVQSQPEHDNACTYANLEDSPPSKIYNVSSEPKVPNNAYSQPKLVNASAQVNLDELSSQARVLNGLSQSEHDDLQSQLELDNACAHNNLDNSPPSKFNNVSSEPKVSNRSLKRRRKKAASLIKHNNPNSQSELDKAFAKKNLNISLQAKVSNGLSQPKLYDVQSQPEHDNACTYANLEDSPTPKLDSVSSEPKVSNNAHSQPKLVNASAQVNLDELSSQARVLNGLSQSQHDDLQSQLELDNACAHNNLDDSPPSKFNNVSSEPKVSNRSLKRRRKKAASPIKHNNANPQSGVDKAFAKKTLDDMSSQAKEVDDVQSQPEHDNARTYANLEDSPTPKLDSVSSEPKVPNNAYSHPKLVNASEQVNFDELSSQATVLNGLSQSEHDDLQSQLELDNACAHNNLDDSPPSKLNNVSSEPKVSNRSLKRRRKKAASPIKHNNANPQPGVDKAFAKKTLDDMSSQPKEVDDVQSQPEHDNARTYANLEDSPTPKLDSVSSEPKVPNNAYSHPKLVNASDQVNFDELSSQATVLNGLSQSEHDDLQSQLELDNACAHNNLDDSPPSKLNNVSSELKVSNRSLKRRRKKAASLIKHNNANSQPVLDKAFAKKTLDDMSFQAKELDDVQSQPEHDNACAYANLEDSPTSILDSVSSEPKAKLDNKSNLSNVANEQSQLELDNAYVNLDDSPPSKLNNVSCEPKVLNRSSKRKLKKAASQAQHDKAHSQLELDNAFAQENLDDSLPSKLNNVSSEPKVLNRSSKRKLKITASKTQHDIAYTEPELDNSFAQENLDDLSSQANLDDASVQPTPSTSRGPAPVIAVPPVPAAERPISLKCILNWPNVLISIYLPGLHCMRLNMREAKYKMVNSKNMTNEVEPLPIDIEPAFLLEDGVHTKDHAQKLVYECLRKQKLYIQSNMTLTATQMEDLDVIFNEIRYNVELGPEDIPGEYKIILNNHKYFRYLYDDVPREEVPLKFREQFEVRLQEIFNPTQKMCFSHVLVQDMDTKFKFTNRTPWLKIHCMSCSKIYVICNLSFDNVFEHFAEPHYDDSLLWTCTNCKLTFPAKYLMDNRWYHECVHDNIDN